MAEYILSRQKWRYPDLDTASKRYGGPGKDPVIEEEYWAQGIDTDKIPRDVLTKYAIQDIVCTEYVFNAQQRKFRDEPTLYPIFRLSSADEIVLEEMEANGIKYDPELCRKRLGEVDRQLVSIDQSLMGYISDIRNFNWNSGDDLSALLFGGIVNYIEEYQDGIFKSGLKAGLPRIRKRAIPQTLPRLYDPDPRWEIAKTKNKTDYELAQAGEARIYKTNDDVLSLVQDKHGLVRKLKELAKWTKIREYYVKLLELPIEKAWQEGMIHGQFNQVVTGTGRSSSSDPNLQNFAGEIQDVFITRY